jgi:hypothetical protein
VAARELEDQPGVDRPEGGTRVNAAVLDQPLDLGAREVGVQHQAGALAEKGLPARFAQLVAAGGRAAVLPHERAVERLARLAVPSHHRLALVRDPDAREPAAADAGRVEGLAGHGASHVPDLAGVVLDPPGAREVLLELPVGAAGDRSPLVEDDAGRAGGALVDREDHDGNNAATHTDRRTIARR